MAATHKFLGIATPQNGQPSTSSTYGQVMTPKNRVPGVTRMPPKPTKLVSALKHPEIFVTPKVLDQQPLQGIQEYCNISVFTCDGNS